MPEVDAYPDSNERSIEQLAAAMPANAALIARMLSYTPGSFDGYPTTSCADKALIDAAEWEAQNQLGDVSAPRGAVMLAYLASQWATTDAEYLCAKSYIAAYVDASWECSMQQSANPVHRKAQAMPVSFWLTVTEELPDGGLRLEVVVDREVFNRAFDATAFPAPHPFDRAIAAIDEETGEQESMLGKSSVVRV